MAFVELPGIDHRQPLHIHFFHDDPERLHGALEYGRIGNIENIAALAQQLTGRMRLGASLLGQAHIRPAGKTVFEIPGALPMTQQHQFILGFHS